MDKIKRLVVSILIIVFSTSSVLGQSIDIDKKMGKKNYQLAVDTYGLYKDSSMVQYINKVGQRLVSNLDSALFEYKFFIINDEIPNAFALPGGYIFITTGIIPIINSEDELAGIIGHEIIHSNNRHTIRQIRKKILPALITLPITIADNLVPIVGILTSPIMAAENMLFASYSRKFEMEADEQGVTLAAKSGYDPLALTYALNRLSETVKYMTGEKEKKSYFADHPYTPDREKDIRLVSENLKTNISEKISKDFIKEFSGIIYGPNPTKGILKDNALLELEKDYYIQYPTFWSVSNMDTLVVGYSPSKTTAFVLSFEDNKLTPEEAAKKYINNFPKKHKYLLVRSETIKINDSEGYLISLEEPWYEDTTFVNLLWLPNGDNLFKISTMSDMKVNKTLIDITKSIRELTEQEKQSVMVQYVDVVDAKENESLTDLCNRTNNKVNVEMVSIINGIDINTKLNKGDEVQIILERPYLQK